MHECPGNLDSSLDRRLPCCSTTTRSSRTLFEVEFANDVLVSPYLPLMEQSEGCEDVPPVHHHRPYRGNGTSFGPFSQ
jgi:hypothetical protein